MGDVKYKHSEAFCLMKYRSQDGSEEEVIWNSRDGVTPFVISLKSGATAQHVDWHLDRRVVDYKPKPGERIFVDLTEERARGMAQRMLDRARTFPGAPTMNVPTVETLARKYMVDGAPDLIEVTE